jgi:hypothetical protein
MKSINVLEEQFIQKYKFKNNISSQNDKENQFGLHSVNYMSN